MQIIYGNVGRILIVHALGTRVELLTILFGPPIFEVALGVKLAAFVVEAVGKLVSDGAAGVSVVRCIVCFAVVNWRLQNPCREVDVVHLRVVVGVHRGG